MKCLELTGSAKNRNGSIQGTGKALGQRWTDVDFRVQSICVEQQVNLPENTPIFGALQTANSRRTAYFVDVL